MAKICSVKTLRWF